MKKQLIKKSMIDKSTLLSTLVLFGLLLIVGSSQAFAHDEDTFAQAEDLIQQKISCSDLTEDQLELIGEYYMEKMHPGEAHELMDSMMGGEGSESLRQVHLSMARRFYCNDNSSSYGGYGMMGRGGMMDMMYGTGYGLMGTGSWFAAGFVWLIWIAVAAFIFGIIFWWTYKLVNKGRMKKR